MFDSSPTRPVFRVLRVVALAAICLASLGPLPRAMASEPTCEITSEQEDQIVETHNLLRSTVQPTASNMRRLVSEMCTVVMHELIRFGVTAFLFYPWLSVYKNCLARQ
jgi:hypothetical protein